MMTMTNKRANSAAWRTQLFALMMLVGIGVAPAEAADQTAPAEIIRAFTASVEKGNTPPALKQGVIKDLTRATSGKDVDTQAITAALIKLYPWFKAGFVALNNEAWGEAVKTFAQLTKSSDPWLASHARYFLARALTQAERFEDAAPHLDSLLAQSKSPLTTYIPDALFWRAACFISELKRKAAEEMFLQVVKHPHSSPELVERSKKILAKLKKFKPGTLPEVTDLMDYSRRHLFLNSDGEIVQISQQDSVKLLSAIQKPQKKSLTILDAIIKEMEKQQGGGGGGGGGEGEGQGKGQGSGQASGQQPGGEGATESSLPPGASQMGTLAHANRGKKGEKWGTLPAKERKRIEAVLKDKYPERYREMVEQYYRSISEDNK